jgi:N-acetylmuramoyl-L-alanine amidase
MVLGARHCLSGLLALLLLGLVACQAAPLPISLAPELAVHSAPARGEATPSVETIAPSATPSSSLTASPSATPSAPATPPHTATPSPSAVPTRIPTATATPRPSRVRTIVLDAGHGLPDPGAVSADGRLQESTLALDIARRAAARLREAGYRVVLTRETEEAVHPAYRSGNHSQTIQQELQRRIDIANEADADLFLSLHNNGSEDRDKRGIEVWFNVNRSFSARNEALARLTLRHIAAAMHDAGYPVAVRRIMADPDDDPDSRFAEGRPTEIYILEPGTNPRRRHEPTRMPGVLVEHAFMSHPPDARALGRPEIREAIARGYLAAVEAYFAQFPS